MRTNGSNSTNGHTVLASCLLRMTKTETQLRVSGRRRRFIAWITIVLAIVIPLPLPATAAPLLLSQFKLDGNGEDALENSPAIDWVVERTTPITIGNQRVIIEDGTVGDRFYRLRRL